MASGNESENSININIRVCRVCFHSDYSTCVQLNSGVWLKLYEYCNNIKIDSRNMSLLLCTNCAEKVKNFAKFKQQCIKSEMMWTTMVLSKVRCHAEQFVLPENIDNEVKEEIDDSIIDDDIYLFEIPVKNDIEDNSLKLENKEQISIIEDHKKSVTSIHINKKKHETNEVMKKIIKKERKKIKKEMKDKKVAKPYKCSRCDKKYKQLKDLEDHRKKCRGKSTILPKSDVLPCGLCDFKCTDITGMKTHLSNHALNDDLNCKLCVFVGRDFADMLTHRFKHHPKEFKIRKFCPLCKKRGGTLMSMEFHYRSEHLNKFGGLCSICNREFRILKMWRNHERLHRENKYICDYCGLKFLFRNTIKAHIINHGDVKNYICEVCGRAFKKKSNMKCHLKNMHSEKIPVQCSHCNKIFKCEDSLNLHLKIVNMEKSISCKVCFKTFSTVKRMERHMIWHSDARPFACEFCLAKFKVKEQLKVHMRRHTGDLPFICTYCDKRFATNKQKRIHLSVHTGVRAYKCEYCDRTFNSKILLKKHYENHRKNFVVVD